VLTPWERFVLRHTHRGNLALHFVSMLMFFGAPVVALVLWSPWPLLAFMTSGLVGTAGHYLFRDGTVSARESTSQPEVPYYVLRMFWLLARGRYAHEVAAAQAKRGA
jgi:hypothetical protein